VSATARELHQRERDTGEVGYVPAIQTDGLMDASPVAVMPNPEAVPYCERTSKDHPPTRALVCHFNQSGKVDRVVNLESDQHKLDVHLGPFAQAAAGSGWPTASGCA
jgi:hypothetical protein